MASGRLLPLAELCIAIIIFIQTALSAACQLPGVSTAQLASAMSAALWPLKQLADSQYIVANPTSAAGVPCCSVHLLPARQSWQQKLLCQQLRHAVFAAADWSSPLLTGQCVAASRRLRRRCLVCAQVRRPVIRDAVCLRAAEAQQQELPRSLSDGVFAAQRAVTAERCTAQQCQTHPDHAMASPCAALDHYGSPGVET